MWKDPVTGEMKDGIAEVRYTHEECIRLLVANPFMTQRELAQMFGVTEAWMSQVMRSDAFRARLAEEKEKFWAPILGSTSEKLEALASASLDKLLDRIAGPAAMPKDELLLKSAQLATTALGYGARPAGERGAGATAQVIINLPGKVQNETAWAERYSTPRGVSDAIEVRPGTPDPA